MIITLNLSELQAQQLLRTLFEQIHGNEHKKVFARNKIFDLPPTLKDHLLEKLEVGTRITCALKNADINTIGELCELGEYDFLRMPNAGRKSLNDTLAALESYVLDQVKP